MGKNKLSEKYGREFKGTVRKNKTDYAEFINLCKMTQTTLKLHLRDVLKLYNYEVVFGDGYVFAKGNIPVLLTAHMDTVHKEQIVNYYEIKTEQDLTILTSPQGIGGDDRCGIYMILEVLKQGKRPWILFCEDEEIGGVGSRKFCKSDYIDELKELKYMIELDRANGMDAVYYDCDNKDFTNYIESKTGYTKGFGTFSDISNLSPVTKVASVNLSCGYYKAHTTDEYVICEEMDATTLAVLDLLDDVEKADKFEYIEGDLYYYGGGYSYNYGYSGLSSYDWYDAYSNYKNKYKSDNETKKDGDLALYVTYEQFGKEKEVVVLGDTTEEAWMNFFMLYDDVSYNMVTDYNWDYIG